MLLTGVRHDQQEPKTRISDVRLALNQLSEKDLDLLRKPLYKINVPYRWRKDGILSTHDVPLVSGPLNLPEVSVVFYPGMIEAKTEDAKLALNNLYREIKRNALSLNIKPGELIYIDNRFTVHSRDKFTGSFDSFGNPMRWIQRVFISPNLWGHRNLIQESSRVFKLS